MANVSVQQAMQVALQQHQAGNLVEAERIYRMVLQGEPNHPDALHLLGVLLGQTGRQEGSLEMLRKAVALRPAEVAFQGNLGRALMDHGEMEEAIPLLERAAQAAPSIEVINSLGYALQLQRKLLEALNWFERALRLDPRHAGTHYNIGNVYRDMGKLDESIARLREAAKLDPTFAEAHNNLGNAYKDAGRLDEALASYREAIKARPSAEGFLSNWLYTLTMHPGYGTATIKAELEAWNRKFALPLFKAQKPHENKREPERRLRIGYVSPDFRDHVVGRNILPLLRSHDREQVEIFCYSYVGWSDTITGQFKKAADQWRDIRTMTDAAAADLIRADRIDILVDLALHMGPNRLLLFARKPAPIQFTFAGYPGSTGVTAIDYRLTDRHLDPPGENDNDYSEMSIRLDTFWCYDPLDITLTPNDLPATSQGHVTFGCLNNFAKVDDRMVRLWAKVMREVPGSRLVLLAAEGSHRGRPRKILESEGVSGDRLRFERLQPRESYMRLYHQLDIGLDTLPYNGHTTSLDSLWMGVPVVTLVGETVVGRAGLSQLTNVSLPELVTRSDGSFIQAAVALAKDLPRLADLRRTLRRQMEKSPLMDARHFAQGIESAYRDAWRRWCASAPN